MTVRGKRVTARTLCATTAFFYDLLGRAEDLDLHRLAAERALEFSDLGVGLPQVTRGDHVLTGLHGRRRARLREPLPIPNYVGSDVELATELGNRLLPGHDPLDRVMMP
jgi:hypothetical protein